MRKLATAALTLLLFSGLSACSTDPEITSGYVVQKNFEPRHWEGGWEEDCDTDWFDEDDDGNTLEQDCDSYWESHHRRVEDTWKIRLEDCRVNDKNERKCYRSWLEVDEDTFVDFRVGDHYPNPA
jgi:hypothetical protein